MAENGDFRPKLTNNSLKLDSPEHLEVRWSQIRPKSSQNSPKKFGKFAKNFRKNRPKSSKKSYIFGHISELLGRIWAERTSKCSEESHFNKLLVSFGRKSPF